MRVFPLSRSIDRRFSLSDDATVSRACWDPDRLALGDRQRNDPSIVYFSLSIIYAVLNENLFMCANYLGLFLHYMQSLGSGFFVFFLFD